MKYILAIAGVAAAIKVVNVVNDLLLAEAARFDYIFSHLSAIHSGLLRP